MKLDLVPLLLSIVSINIFHIQVKFFGIELGTQTAYDAPNERAVINGKHAAADLQKMLEKFITMFVLCPTCKLPELNMGVSQRSQRIKIDCAACGHNGALQSSHRLATFIVNHPPPKVKRGAHKDAEDVDEASAKEAAEQKALRAARKRGGEEAEVEWHTDTSEDAVRQRKLAEFGESAVDVERMEKVANIISMAQAAGMSDAPSTILRLFITSKDRTTNEIVAELRRLQISRSLDDPQKVKVLLETFIDPLESKTIHTQFANQANLFSKFTSTTSDAHLFIACIEDFVGEVHSDLLPRFPLIMKSLYDADILTEDQILSWHDSPPETNWMVKKEIATATRSKTTPLVNWLQEQDEEEDEDDEE